MRPSPLLNLPILKRSSYYESDYRQSAALIRARRPYLVKNAITGIAITSFAIGVCES
jgi:cytochrome c oxidase assembly factor 3, fungi type